MRIEGNSATYRAVNSAKKQYFYIYVWAIVVACVLINTAVYLQVHRVG